jgi:hypothetical protein
VARRGAAAKRGHVAIMLAPTRELARTLNQQAGDHRLEVPCRQVELADANRARVGDVVITRNDRRLRIHGAHFAAMTLDVYARSSLTPARTTSMLQAEAPPQRM